MLANLLKKNHFWGLTLVGGLAVGGLLLGLHEFANQSDRSTREREQSVVMNGFSARMHEIEAQSVTNSVWDAAVENLDNRFSARWAEENVGAYFLNNGNFQFSFVLDHNDKPRFAQFGEKVADASTFNDVAPQISNLLLNVRAQERLRRSRGVKPGETLRNPIQASAPLWLQDRLYIVTATLVQPDFGHAAIKHPRAPIVITGRELNSSFMELFGQRYLLKDVHLHNGDSRSEPGEAHAPIFDPSGQEIATLDWTPQTPGVSLTQRFQPWILGFAGAMCTVILWLYSVSWRQAQKTQIAEARTKFLAYHDALTTMPNRAQLDSDLAQKLAAGGGQILALHCLNLAHFKDVNDTHGINVGDELLKAAALRLAMTCGAEARVYRLGGDEFAVLQSIDNAPAAEAFADRLLEALSTPFTLSIGDKKIGAYAGIAFSKSEDCTGTEMLRRANLALFRAKGAGIGMHLSYEDKMDEELRRKAQLKEDLRSALSDGGLHMVYQPQVRLNGQIVGMEALIRWTHPTLGPLSPVTFIPLAEESGLIKEIGDFALRQASLDSLSWGHIKVAVNVSATQLQDESFAEHAKAIVASQGADLHDIEIELTEGVLLADSEHTRATLLALRDAGFSIALDDFGTGYSSLSYLQRFPIDKLKIDRAFVQNLGLDPKADALFTAIVRLAQSLDMRVIAEGVETEEQWLRLTGAGCPKIQGYIASKPLRAEDVPAFITHWRSERSDQSAAMLDDRGVAVA